MNPKCIFTKEAARAKKNQGEFFTRKENTPRYIGQMQSLYSCLQSIEKFEKDAQMQFDAIVKTRPDATWFLPSFSAQEYLLRGDLVTHFSDIFIFAPRRYAKGFVQFWDNYTQCDGTWKGAYFPELALDWAFRDLGAIYYYDRQTPVSIRRASRNETSAFWICKDQRRVSVQRCMRLVYDVDDKFAI
mmetsp:Transcript_18871/g.36449  ORF Transcript_18871/g.36449 Transcript_18871/m.36449 type:complete len:187 (-) Transcript_18871:33-593(-)